MLIPYYIWGTSSIQTECIYWNLVFLAINVFWIVVIFRERIPPKMSEQQKQLFNDVFKPSCSPKDMLKLLSVAKWVDCNGGEKIIQKAGSPNGLFLISRGNANVIVEKVLVASLGRGDFVGEMSYLTGEPAVADVEAASKMQYIHWEKDTLVKLLDGRPELKSAVNEIIGRDLIQKLGSREVKVPELSVETIVM